MNNKNRNILVLIGLAVLIIFLYPKFAANNTDYTIVGQLRGCSINPDESLLVSSPITLNVASTCNSGHGLIDIFGSNDIDEPYQNFIKEQSDSITNFNSNYQYYTAEIYCCPKSECNYNSDCPGGTCETYYMEDAPSTDEEAYYADAFKYCSYSEEEYTTCWYNDGSGCKSRDYLKSLMPTCSGSWQGYPLYSSQTSCPICKSQAQSCTSNSQCCSGLTCQNFGCYPSSVCGDGICQSTETKTSCSADCGIAPVCGDGTCDAGETTGATYDCPADCNSGSGISESLTWTKFYSISNEKFREGDYSCGDISDCQIAESGYKLTCNKEELISDRTYVSLKSECDSGIPWVFKITDALGLKQINTFHIICDLQASSKSWYASWNQGGTGVCIAESTTWYGGIWDSMLKGVGGMLPADWAAYVMIITALGIVLIGVILFSTLTK